MASVLREGAGSLVSHFAVATASCPAFYRHFGCFSNNLEKLSLFLRSLTHDPELGLLVERVTFEGCCLFSDEDRSNSVSGSAIVLSSQGTDTAASATRGTNDLLFSLFRLTPNIQRLSISDGPGIGNQDIHPRFPPFLHLTQLEVIVQACTWDSYYEIPTFPRDDGEVVVNPLRLVSPSLKVLTVRHPAVEVAAQTIAR